MPQRGGMVTRNVVAQLVAIAPLVTEMRKTTVEEAGTSVPESHENRWLTAGPSRRGLLPDAGVASWKVAPRSIEYSKVVFQLPRNVESRSKSIEMMSLSTVPRGEWIVHSTPRSMR